MGEVVLGVDTHRDAHVAAVLSVMGTILATDEFPATPAGYRDLLKWARKSGAVRRAGVEGTGSYGASLSRYLLNRRLNRGGDRQANAALHRIVFTHCWSTRALRATTGDGSRRARPGAKSSVASSAMRLGRSSTWSNSYSRAPLIGAVVTDERLGRVSETTEETLPYRFDGPEDAPILVLGPALGTTWHMS
jgi:hypothetical protein